LPLALIDFDLAIKLDPNFSDAYIDRAIVFRNQSAPHASRTLHGASPLFSWCWLPELLL